MKLLTSLLCFLILLGCSGESASEQKMDNKIEEESRVLGLFGSKETKNYVIASPLSGVLVKDGKPLANTKIIRRLTWNGNEEGTVSEFTTDAEGYFTIPVHEETLTLNTMTEFVASSTLYVDEVSDENFFWYSPKRTEGLYSETGGMLEEVVCELSNEEDRVTPENADTYIFSKCKWQNKP